MAARIDARVAQELQPAARAFEPDGFRLAATEGAGAMFSAEFRSASGSFLVVKDRDFWYIDGKSAMFKTSPSRNSQSAAIKDAIAWITQGDA